MVRWASLYYARNLGTSILFVTYLLIIEKVRQMGGGVSCLGDVITGVSVVLLSGRAEYQSSALGI